MPRVSIYVTDEMKKDLDRLGESVNWSKLAQETFSLRITQLKAMETKDMETALARLRAEKEAADETDYNAGLAAGQVDAMNTEYTIVRTLATFDTEDLEHRRYKEADYDVIVAGLLDLTPDELFGGDYTNQYVLGFLAGYREVYAQI